MDMNHVDVLAVKLAEHRWLHDLAGCPARGPAGRHIDDPVHHRKQWIHLVRRDQHRDPLLLGDARDQGDNLLLAADVEIGQRLVKQQQPGPADQRVRDKDPLLLAAG